MTCCSFVPHCELSYLHSQRLISAGSLQTFADTLQSFIVLQRWWKMACISKARWNSFTLALFLFIPPTLHPSFYPPPFLSFPFLLIPSPSLPSSLPFFPLPTFLLWPVVLFSCDFSQMSLIGASVQHLLQKESFQEIFFCLSLLIMTASNILHLTYCVTLGNTKKNSFNIFFST